MTAPLFDGPILVTGATGFLGQHLVHRLIELGQPVIATGRNIKVGLGLQAAGADFRPVDLRDRAGMIAAAEGAKAVVHSGALSSVWGRRKDFHAINVGGTENVIAACRANGVKRLVYISSPSVMTRPTAQLNLNESEPLPDKHVSIYSETKRLGEELVHQAAAASADLETVILRPKAIYGPGDTAIFPRLIKAASKGRLPIIGDGNTITNLTHVRDVVAAILLALKSEKAVGNTYLITGGEDVRIWDAIKEVVTRSGYKAPTRKIKIGRAMRAARVLEWVWRTLHLPGEPPLTTYTAGILGLSQTYDISAARRDLGYEPSVRLEEGIAEAFPTTPAPAVAKRQPPPKAVPPNEPPEVGIRIRTAGIAWVRPFTFQPGGGFKWMAVPALYAHHRAPDAGASVVGYGLRAAVFRRDQALPLAHHALRHARGDPRGRCGHQPAESARIRPGGRPRHYSVALRPGSFRRASGFSRRADLLFLARLGRCAREARTCQGQGPPLARTPAGGYCGTPEIAPRSGWPANLCF